VLPEQSHCLILVRRLEIASPETDHDRMAGTVADPSRR
jgi:hypothetical protein